MGSQLPAKRGTAPPPQFSVHVYCGQTAGWTNTPLGTEVGLGSGYIVLDGDPVAPRNGYSSPPMFSAHLYCGHGHPSQPHCVRWGPSCPPPKGAQHPNFWPISVAAKWLHGSRCDLVWRQALACRRLCSMGTQLPPEKGHTHPYQIFGPCLFVAKRLD